MQVHVLYEAWGSDTPSVIGVFTSDAALTAKIRELSDGEDDYTASRRSFSAEVYDLQGAQRCMCQGCPHGVHFVHPEP